MRNDDSFRRTPWITHEGGRRIDTRCELDAQINLSQMPSPEARMHVPKLAPVIDDAPPTLPMRWAAAIVAVLCVVAYAITTGGLSWQ